MSTTLTIELCTEDRARLDRILAALERTPTNAVTGLPDEKPEAPEHKPEPKQEEKPAIDLATLQALVQELAAPGTGKFEQVKKIVKQYAPKVSQIPEKDWNACHAALLALKEGKA